MALLRRDNLPMNKLRFGPDSSRFGERPQCRTHKLSEQGEIGAPSAAPNFDH
jgi:hypothetical protein